MIIIYNLAGLLVGILGLAVGAILIALTGKVSVGFLALTIIWCWLGRSKYDPKTELKTTAPSIFFIPLFFWGILGGVLTVPALLIDVAISTGALDNLAENGGGNNDPFSGPNLAERFRNDESGLKSNATDDPTLSSQVNTFISGVVPNSPVSHCVKTGDDSTLILVKLTDLKKVKDGQRLTLLNGIRDIANKLHPEREVYIGIKGKLLYGAILIPNQPPHVAAAVPQDLLYGFYKPATTMPIDEPDNYVSETQDPVQEGSPKSETVTVPDEKSVTAPEEKSE